MATASAAKMERRDVYSTIDFEEKELRLGLPGRGGGGGGGSEGEAAAKNGWKRGAQIMGWPRV
ncbi:hypothetical protein AKJ16_DCAP02830 [Drosera capensis]